VNKDFQSEILVEAIFSTPLLHLTPPYGDPCRYIAIMFGAEKLEWWGYLVVKKLNMCLAVLTEYRRVADGHTVHLVTA